MTAYIGLKGTETRGNETNGKITSMALRRLYPFVISYANNCIYLFSTYSHSQLVLASFYTRVALLATGIVYCVITLYWIEILKLCKRISYP